MSYSSILINQIILMFIIIAIGLCLKVKKFYSDEFISTLGRLLLLVINPLAIFNSFVNQYTPKKAMELLIGFGLAFVCYLISIIFSEIFFHNKKYYLEKFCIVTTNCAFFGLPIVMALFGNEAVFYGAPFIVFNNIYQWTYGVYIMTNDKKQMSFKKIITNPNILAFILGVIFFFLRIPVIKVVCDTFTVLGNMMGPICSLIIGSTLASTNLADLKKDLSIIGVTIIRLIIVPLCVLFIFKYVDNKYETIKYVLLIMSSTPSGTSSTVIADMYHKDTAKAARIVCFTTLLCSISIPLIVSLADKIW